MTRTSPSQALLIALMVLGGNGPAVACPRYESRNVMLTDNGATLIDGGGPIFMMVIGTSRSSHVPPVPRLTHDDRVVPATPMPLFGPYYKLVPSKPPPTLVVVNGGERIEMRRGSVPVLDRPQLSAIRVVGDRRGPQRRDVRQGFAAGYATTIELSSLPPTDALVLVFYGPHGEVGWVPISDRQSKTLVVKSGGRCSEEPTFVAPEGARLEAAWLDRFGRLSATSSITVDKAR